MGMAVPNIGSLATPAVAVVAPASTNSSSSPADDASKKIRKPYTITKSRESWTDPEHDKFLEALQLFDRDWKKIEAFIGSKTVIQIRSHAQKYFLKVQKSGTNEHLPPPRPKGKLHILPIHRRRQKVLMWHLEVDWWILTVCSSDETAPKTRHTVEIHEQISRGLPSRVLPDFSQVYGFIGSVFDPNSIGHVQRLKKMDPIDVETVLLLMRNLSINLTSPDFEDHVQSNKLTNCFKASPLKGIACQKEVYS
ncbi:hypothetical protein E3N88_22432 [Mikania micrantha]|uniref:Uncharacterized protein n=1 Tax=Mikania micrantha TaxID=192012 RepID=A0A5N6NAG0_9ASTR|nr:hypothetical protein E3N88_22432 [Mikania micrantha]